MNYIKKLFNAIVPVLKYIFLSYLCIFVFYIFFVIFGGTDTFLYVNRYATIVLVVFNIIYIRYLCKNNRILCKKTKPIFYFVMLGVGISTFFNMIIYKLDIRQISDVNINMNLLFLILSSVIVGPVVEEIIFRNILVSKIEKFNNRFFTIIISSFIFSIIHTGFVNVIYAFFLGVILNTIYIKNKNLLYPLVVHSSANLIALFLTEFNIYILFLGFTLLVVSMFIVKRDYLLK